MSVRTVKTFAAKVTPTAGGFTAVASTADLDRDGEVIDPGAFEPLPKTVPLLAFHKMDDPIGLVRPRYQGGRLMIDATFASTARAQEVRALVSEGAVPAVSVGFMAATKKSVNGVPHITRAELIEVSVVSIPSNRAAVILEQRAAKWGTDHEARDALTALRVELALTRAALLTGRPVRPDDPRARAGFTPSHVRAQKESRR